MNSNVFLKLFRFLLLPFSLIYGLVIFLRNKLFDWNIKKTVSYNFPVISVGNITVGGTGKTPHTEFLLNLLSKEFRTAVLSRGYKRKTKGFVLASKSSTPEEIGDESYQIHMKYPESLVAVCESRVEGIKNLLLQNPNPNIVLLDDAFQHRYVNPGLSILLVDYNRPVYRDFYLPTGNLRDGFYSRKRADIIIVTKTPGEMVVEDYKYWRKKLRISDHQKVYFSQFEYGNLKPVFLNQNKQIDIPSLKNLKTQVLLITGIAEPKPLIEYIESHGLSCEIIRFADHHNFSDTDLKSIHSKYDKLNSKARIIITTEKDAVRIMHLMNYPETLKEATYYLPISVKILEDKEEEFKNYTLKYARRD